MSRTQLHREPEVIPRLPISLLWHRDVESPAPGGAAEGQARQAADPTATGYRVRARARIVDLSPGRNKRQDAKDAKKNVPGCFDGEPACFLALLAPWRFESSVRMESVVRARALAITPSRS